MNTPYAFSFGTPFAGSGWNSNNAAEEEEGKSEEGYEDGEVRRVADSQVLLPKRDVVNFV
jgi:hypothetical protein